LTTKYGLKKGRNYATKPLRINQKTKKIYGFTLLNASRRQQGKSSTASLPFSLMPPTVRVKNAA